MPGHTFMVRFADDFIVGFKNLEDAQKVVRVIDKRFARFGLKVNTEKDAAGAVQAPAVARGRPAGRSRDARFPWVHALLGEDTSRQLRGEAEDRGKAVPASTRLHRAVGSGQSAS